MKIGSGKHMRALRVTGFGSSPEILDTAIPTPGPDEVRVAIRACGLNFADLLMIDGKYQDTPEVPFTLGMEVSGIIEDTGPDTAAPAKGTRVAVFGGKGGLAEYGVFPADRCVVLPDGMSYADAAAFQIAYGTSHVALDFKARLKPGERLLVLGAAGGVGLTAVELGKLMGAEVIAVARGAEKLKVAKKAGADHLIDPIQEDLLMRLRELGGVDVVYDPVGGDQFKAAMRACRPDARLLVIGFASGDIPQIPANHLLVKNINVLGLYWGGYLRFRPEVITKSMAQLFRWFAQGKIKPHVSHNFSFRQANEALELLRSRQSTGKIVVTIDPA